MRFTGLRIAMLPGMVLGVLLIAGVSGPLTAIAAPEPGLESLLAYRRIQCTVADEVPVVYGWTGSTYSRVRGEPDRRLFKLTGMNIRQCVTVNDPKLGVGFRMVTREVMIYRYYDDLTLEAIADLVGTSRKTVGKRLERVRAELKTLSASEPEGDRR